MIILFFSSKHTHTYTHTQATLNTLTQSKSGSYKLIRFLEVEEIGFTVDLKVSMVVAFLMCSGSEFQTEGPKKEKSRSPFILHL